MGGMHSTVDTLRASLAAYKKAKGKFGDLAISSGVPISTIYKISCGARKNLGTNTVDKLFRALGVTGRLQ
jgi:predicted transcriptional regulator